MELDNAIIIALIVIILLVLGAFVFISSNNISIQKEPAIENGANSSVQINASRANGADKGVAAPNSDNNQEAIDNFIECVSKISDCVNSDNWNGEDVM